jgi:hypothetical protein
MAIRPVSLRQWLEELLVFNAEYAFGPVRAVLRGRPSVPDRVFSEKRGGRGGPPVQD